MDRHYKIKFENGDDIRIIRQNGDPNLYEAVEHVLINTNPDRYSKAGTVKLWILRGSDGKWRIKPK